MIPFAHAHQDEAGGGTLDAAAVASGSFPLTRIGPPEHIAGAVTSVGTTATVLLALGPNTVFGVFQIIGNKSTTQAVAFAETVIIIRDTGGGPSTIAVGVTANHGAPAARTYTAVLEGGVFKLKLAMAADTYNVRAWGAYHDGM